MITGKSIGTLVVFIISLIFVIHPVYIAVTLPYFGRRKIPINLTTAPIVAIAILWAAQCINPAVIRGGIVGTEGVKPYNILILFFSLAYMAITLDVTGVLRAAAYWVSNKGGADGWKLYFYFYVMLTLLSVLVGNDPVILSGTAFLVYYTQVVEELKPLPWLITEFAAANTASMVLFVGNPTNVVICEGFGVNNAAFTAYMILPFLACSVACFMALAVQYRSSQHLPRKITPTQLDVRLQLLDPLSAMFGSICLGICLIIIIVISFFKAVKVEVWMISLPFAVVKFIFDLTWDNYKWVKKNRMHGRVQSDTDKEIPSETQMSSSPNVIGDILPTITSKGQRQLSLSTNKTLVNGHVTYDHDPILPPYNEVVPERTASEPIPERNTRVPPRSASEPRPPRRDTRLPVMSSPELASSRAENRTSQSPSPLRETQNNARFHTFLTALPRLPFALVPFAFSQFILIEALSHQGWIDVFATWLVRASHRQMHPTIWLIGVIGVIMCNLAGTNIGATILLTKVVRAANMPDHSLRAAAIALAVASNIGAVSFTFSASLAGLLWSSILGQKGIKVRQREFARWNILPLVVMTSVGLSVVSAEMAVLYGGKVS